MYAKLFSRITESSLMEEPINVRYTFVLMLAIADPEGYVIGTDVAIARRLNMPLAEFEKCLETLLAPDPHSNSKLLNGVRLVNSDGERGYKIVNYTTYRDLKSPEDRREYMRNYMRDRRKAEKELTLGNDVNSVNNCKSPLAQLGQAEAEAEATDSIKVVGESTILGKPPSEKSSLALTRKKFVKPTLEEVEAYCDERDNAVPAQAFLDHYDSCGWVVGKGGKPMKDWRAAIRSVWEPKHPKPESRVLEPKDFHKYNPVTGVE